MGITWNAEADAKLLIAIIQTAKPKIDHDAVAKHMDCDVSGYAVQHRLRKLRAIAKGGGDGSEPSTPAKAKANSAKDVTKTPSPQKGTPKTPTDKKRRAAEKDEEDGVDDAGEAPKKVKYEASVRGTVKNEYA